MPSQVPWDQQGPLQAPHPPSEKKRDPEGPPAGPWPLRRPHLLGALFELPKIPHPVPADFLGSLLRKSDFPAGPGRETPGTRPQDTPAPATISL